MEQTLAIALSISLWTLGVYFATYEGEFLHEIKKQVESVLGPYWSKPILGCPYCMPSVHGFFICGFWHILHLDFCTLAWWSFLVQWVVSFVFASAFNHFLFNLIEVVRGYAGLFDQKNTDEKSMDDSGAGVEEH